MTVSDVIIRSSPGGIATRIKDIAQIKDGFEKNQITPHLNGKPTIALSIRKSEEADNIRVCDRIKEKSLKSIRLCLKTLKYYSLTMNQPQSKTVLALCFGMES